MRDSGLVLKNYLPTKNKVIVLNNFGECLELRVNLPASVERLRPGYRIDYVLLVDTYGLKIKDVEVVFVPKSLDYVNLQFLHQVLELCILIIPVGQVAIEVVDWLKLLAICDTSVWSCAQRRLFICCLLGQAGFCPELKSQDYKLIDQMHKINILKPVDFVQFKIDANGDSLLNKWIVDFVNSHVSPRLAALFVTVYQN